MNIPKSHISLTVPVLFLAVALVVTTVIPTGSAQANSSLAPAPLAATATIYGDSLAAGWQDWSWNARRNLSNPNPTQSGPASISVALSGAWGALYLHGNTALSTTGYTHLEFYIHGGTSGSQRLKVVANRNDSKAYQITASANQWVKVSIPLSNLGSPSSITDLWWQDAAGKVQPDFYIDSIGLAGASAPAPTATKAAPTATKAAPTATKIAPTATKAAPTATKAAPTATKPAPTATKPPSSSGGITIYADQLAAGWQNWSWGNNNNLSNSSPVQSGSSSIAVTFNQAWAGFYFHSDAGLNTAGYTALRFWIHGGSTGGQNLIFAVNRNNNNGTRLTLKANTWTQVDVPLSAFGNPATINDLWWHDALGRAQPVFYVDNIILVSGSGTQPTANPTSVPTAVKSPTPGTTKYFTTLPPGSKLPSDAECAAMVKSRPENKGINLVPNRTPGNQKLASNFFSGGDPRANTEIAARVTGNFTGTTDEILQWAACKWGIDEDMVRAQAAVESWWRQDTKGDWTSNASECAPGHGLGVDGQPGLCPGSWGILQNRYSIEMSSWPGIENSTAFNADTAYGIWRACYEGYEWWLNQVDRGWDYGSGDAYGCMGRWLSGRWHTDAAEGYIAKVKDYLNSRIWESQNFQQP